MLINTLYKFLDQTHHLFSKLLCWRLPMMNDVCLANFHVWFFFSLYSDIDGVLKHLLYPDVYWTNFHMWFFFLCTVT